MMGGSGAHEYMAPCPAGENEVALAPGYAANVEVAAAGVPHLAVADQPTTGGVWVAIGSVADLRVGVAQATVGFSGPRVIEAMTGVAVPRGTNTAETAAAAGLLDAVVPPEGLATWLEQALVTLRPDDPRPVVPPPPVAVPDRSGWEQVRHSRAVDRPDGLDELADTHIWTPESVRTDRLDFRPKHRLTVLVVQARPLLEPVRLPRDPAYAGCKSWVDVSVPVRWGAPVHDDAVLAAVADRVRASVG